MAFDPIVLILAAVSAVLAVAALSLFAKVRGQKAVTEPAQGRAAALEAELAALRAKPVEREFRIERYDVLWFPVVTSSPAEKKVLGVKSGLPHCKKCALPLKAATGSEAWSCSACGAQSPASVTDLYVSDSIAKLALQYFQQRHSDYVAPD
ncbi:MAG: hypothetical protein ABII00_00600 [Elusimicrobiota bacterium]